ncbi:MAG: alanine--tRNA ligase [Anaerolineae bacterium]|nr:alanine--tRNA ligase [Anaerolineae bacterium]
METWTSAEIRQSFLNFFRERGHTIVPSASLIPVDDPTLLFINAGMNQFKDIFLGLAKRDYTRAADTQKVMRVSGKHNDLEEVGHSNRHHTFFEMLGNWSFGDYYKKEAIAWAWELLTKVWGMPKEKLYASIFEDDYGDLGADEEAIHYWRTETDIDPVHIIPFGRKDNFWEMGETGPCGPCSEIHIDRGPEFCDKQGVPGHICQVNGDCQRIVEFWNLVFIQYNRQDANTLEPLPARHVDTGMGFERMVSILQNVHSNYDTDLFVPLLDRIQSLLGHTDVERQTNQIAYRVIADHGRAITFLIGDGVMPGNEGREYVLRMILRRAARFGRKIGFEGPFLAEIAQVVIDLMGAQFQELVARRSFILNTITQEEERFLRTLDHGLTRINEIVETTLAAGKTVISGRDAFVLWTQDGFPYDLIRDIAQERNLLVDRAGFDVAMDEHRIVSGKGVIGEIDVGVLSVYSRLLGSLQAEGSLPDGGVEHLYEESVEVEGKVLAMLRVEENKDGARTLTPVKCAQPGDRVEVVLAETPFYVESGGQMTDSGVLVRYEHVPDDLTADEVKAAAQWVIAIEEARRPVAGLIVHAGTVQLGEPEVGDLAWAMVDYERRADIARNHTATHLLHSELRYVLGEHVQQAGSLVAPDRLRFDFSHGSMLTQDQLDEVEYLVNAAILADYPVEVYVEGYQDAVAEGAMALFGEKYGDEVRVITVGYEGEEFSKELCGGTHVNHTSQIGLFRIVSESSVAAGVRRIEAVTGHAAQELAQNQMNALGQAAVYLGCRPEEVDRKVLALLDEQKALRKEIDTLNRRNALSRFEGILRQVRQVNGVSVLSTRVEADNVSILREMCDRFRDQIGSGVVVLGAIIDDKPMLVAAVTQDLVQKGLHAGNVIRDVAQVVGGGGGGRATMAQAGGRDPSRLSDALALVPGLVEQALLPSSEG